jgi:two-component system OmpR family sensor kinase
VSLRTRLLIVLGILLGTYVVAALVIVSTQRSLLIEQIDVRLASINPGDFAGLIEAPPGLTGDEPPPPGQPEDEPGTNVTVARESPFSDLYIGLIEANGTHSALITGVMAGGPPDILAAVRGTDGGPGIVTVDAVSGSSRFRAIVVPQPADGAWLIAAQSLDEVDAAMGRLVRTLWIAGGIIALVLGLAFFWIQRLGLRPIGRVTAIAEAIAAGDRSRRVEVVNEGTEAGKLGQAFNVMLDERDAGETRLRQFVADASHELRTPLTSVRGYLELYQQGAFRNPGQLDDVVRRLSAESARMHGLVEDLLALASLDEDRPLRLTPVDTGQLLRDAAQDGQAAQPGRCIDIVAPPEGPVLAGDEALLTQLVGILVANALIHTPVDAPVTLAASRDKTMVEITVADRGPGLEPEAAARVFDRFWRGEASRTRSAGATRMGSTGLGLAIARSITDAHGGSISLDTAPGEGCTFTIRLPVAHET